MKLSTLNGYAAVREGKKYVYLHRKLMNAPVGTVVDHINGDKLDNRIENLRMCTVSENARNAVHTSKKDSLPKGVYKHPNPKRTKPYQVKFKWNCTTVSYGYYATVEEAAAAYLRGIELYHGEFATHLSRKEETK